MPPDIWRRTFSIYTAAQRRESSDLTLFGFPSARCAICIRHWLYLIFGFPSASTLSILRPPGVALTALTAYGTVLLWITLTVGIPVTLRITLKYKYLN